MGQCLLAQFKIWALLDVLTIQTTALTIQATALTIQAAALTMQAAALTMQATTLTMQAAALTIQAAALTIQATALTMQAAAVEGETLVVPVQAELEIQIRASGFSNAKPLRKIYLYQDFRELVYPNKN
ncbi:hypothetical protein BV378_33540 [Nostoc sp. RF31YmG]|nr:hypothetical protein BV378_33540 [Nostoc sp. RF31YmG]